MCLHVPWLIGFQDCTALPLVLLLKSSRKVSEPSFLANMSLPLLAPSPKSNIRVHAAMESKVNHAQIEKPASALIFPKFRVGTEKYCPPSELFASELRTVHSAQDH
jgi:hypothetical protein